MAGKKSDKSGRRAARRAERKFADKVHDYVTSHAAPPADKAMFKDALGYGRLCNSMLASDLALRRKSADFLGTTLERLRSDNPRLKFHFWTLLHDRGNTSDRQPVIDLKFLRSLADRTFRKLGLDGIYVVEVQGLGNHPIGGKGRTIMTHIHALTWTSEPINIEQIEREQCEGGNWCSELGAHPVRIKEVIDKPGELDYMAYYLFKPPYDVKMLEKRKSGDRLKSTEKGYKPEFSARLLELLSQLELKELVRACGSGASVRQEWNRRLTNWHRSREHWAQGNLPSYHFDALWNNYRPKKKKVAYEPYTINR